MYFLEQERTKEMIERGESYPKYLDEKRKINDSWYDESGWEREIVKEKKVSFLDNQYDQYDNKSISYWEPAVPVVWEAYPKEELDQVKDSVVKKKDRE